MHGWTIAVSASIDAWTGSVSAFLGEADCYSRLIKSPDRSSADPGFFFGGGRSTVSSLNFENIP
jgi:hypothetical protein